MGYTKAKSDALITMLCRHVERLEREQAPGFLPFHWHADGRDGGQLVIWDETATQHAGTRQGYAGHRRELNRVLVSGEGIRQF